MRGNKRTDIRKFDGEQTGFRLHNPCMVILILAACWTTLALAVLGLMHFAPYGYCDSGGFHLQKIAPPTLVQIHRFKKFCACHCRQRRNCAHKQSALRLGTCADFELHAKRTGSQQVH